jgi:hypothetical protein
MAHDIAVYPPALQTWWGAIPEFLRMTLDQIMSASNRQLDVSYFSYRGCQLLMLDTVPEGTITLISPVRETVDYRTLAPSLETLSGGLILLPDDDADQRGDRRMVTAARDYVTSRRVDETLRRSSPTFRVFIEVWDTYLSLLHQTPQADSPHFADYLALLMAEWALVFDAMDYSMDINDALKSAPSFAATGITYADAVRRLSPNMHVVVKHLTDMLCSAGKVWTWQEIEELVAFSRRAEIVTRKGNWLQTWEQEVRQSDFTSGVVIYALEHGLLTLDDLTYDKDHVINRIKNPLAVNPTDHIINLEIEGEIRALGEADTAFARERGFAARCAEGLKGVLAAQLASKNERR